MTKSVYFTVDASNVQDGKLTPYKNYKIVEGSERNYIANGAAFLADIHDDDGELLESIFVGWPCAYLNGIDTWYISNSGE